MKFSRFIPLIITVLLSFTAVFSYLSLILDDWVISSGSYAHFNRTFLGGGALVIVGLSIFFKRNIWIHLFAIVLILNFIGTINLHNINFNFNMGSFKLNLVAVLLMLLHFAFNVDAFTFKKKVPEDSDK